MKYDWKELQRVYDEENLSWRGLFNRFGVRSYSIHRAIKRGDFISRNKSDAMRISSTGRKHSQETKDKLSNIRRKYLEEHPDKVPYLLNHSSKQSYPELLFENALLKNKINGWESKYRSGIYEYDFAFPDFKLDVEIDGGTHLSNKVKEIDNRRDKWSKSKGWKVIRFTAIEVKVDVQSCIEKLKMYLPPW